MRFTCISSISLSSTAANFGRGLRDAPNAPGSSRASAPPAEVVGAGNSSMPAPAVAAAALDVDGDGTFSPADYVALMRLGLAWSNLYAADAGPWLAAFQEVTGVAEVSAVQLQSTDPDFLYAPPPPSPPTPPPSALVCSLIALVEADAHSNDR